MSNSFDQIVEEHHALLEQDAPVEDVIASLHDAGLNIIESIKAVRLLYHVNLKNAHEIVASHPVWASIGRRNKSFGKKAVNTEKNTYLYPSASSLQNSICLGVATPSNPDK